jgi:hypothetical protein
LAGHLRLKGYVPLDGRGVHGNQEGKGDGATGQHTALAPFWGGTGDQRGAPGAQALLQLRRSSSQDGAAQKGINLCYFCKDGDKANKTAQNNDQDHRTLSHAEPSQKAKLARAEPALANSDSPDLTGFVTKPIRSCPSSACCITQLADLKAPFSNFDSL